MNESQLKALKEKIEDEIRVTQEKISKYSELCRPISPENSIGRISRMDAINNKSVVEAALRELKNKLIELRNSEILIHKPEFGICISCRTSIKFGRLLIRPQSKKCVNCCN